MAAFFTFGHRRGHWGGGTHDGRDPNGDIRGLHVTSNESNVFASSMKVKRFGLEFKGSESQIINDE